MNFQDLLKIEPGQFYLDMAFKKAKERSDIERDKFKIKSPRDKMKKSKTVESVRIDVIASSIMKRLQKIIESYPSFEQLPDFYQELVKITIDYKELKRSLASIQFVINKTKDFQKMYAKKIARTKEMPKINEYRREFYGRISSLLKKIEKQLRYLEEVRKIMKGFPTIKTSVPTVSLFGFPNIGKTTLLHKLTGSKPDIQSYAFTTRRINVSYMGEGKERIQLLDTPGALDRFEKMNNIEKQAYLALKHVTDAIIYIFDLTEEYPLEKQVKLYEKTKKEHKGKKIIVYLSKTDIIQDKELIDKYVKKYKAITTLKELKETITKSTKSIKKESSEDKD